MTKPTSPATFVFKRGTRLFFAISFVASLLVASGLRAENIRPNILFMFTDDQPQNCMGVMGNAAIHTPNLDELARRNSTSTHR